MRPFILGIRSEFGTRAFKIREIKMRVVSETIFSPALGDDHTFELTSRLGEDIAFRRRKTHRADEASRGFFGGKFTKHSNHLGVVRGVSFGTRTIDSGKSRGMNSWSAVKRIDLETGIIRKRDSASHAGVGDGFDTCIFFKCRTILDRLWNRDTQGLETFDDESKGDEYLTYLVKLVFI